MKKDRRNESITLSSSRWLAYATAGAATAFSAASSADAEIHYSGIVNAKFAGEDLASFPLASSRAFIGFTHNINYYEPYVKTGGNAHVAGVSVAGFWTCTSSSFTNKSAAAYNLARGEAISERQFFFGNGKGVIATADGANCYGQDRGEFLRAGIGLIGFKFNVGNGDQYGWARIEAFGLPRNQYRLIDYAYGDPGDRVRAGQKTGGHTPTSESLGALALGAVGLLAWRKRRVRATTVE